MLVWNSRKVFTKDKVYVLPVRRMLKYNKLSIRRWELPRQFHMIPCYRQTSPGLEKLDNTENRVRYSRRSMIKDLCTFVQFWPSLSITQRYALARGLELDLCTSFTHV